MGPRPRGRHLKISEGEIVIGAAGRPRVLIRNGREILVEHDRRISPDRLFRLGLRAGVPAALFQRRGLVMHAAAVAIGGRSVLFTGPSKAGKSTLSATLGLRGHQVLADDFLGIDPSPPPESGRVVRLVCWEKSHHLRPATLTYLFDRPESPEHARIKFSVPTGIFPAPVAILLPKRGASPDAPTLLRVSAAAAAVLLSQQLRGGRFLAPWMFDDFSRTVMERLATLPTYALNIPDGWQGYDRVLDAVEAVAADPWQASDTNGTRTLPPLAFG